MSADVTSDGSLSCTFAAIVRARPVGKARRFLENLALDDLRNILSLQGECRNKGVVVYELLDGHAPSSEDSLFPFLLDRAGSLSCYR